LQYVPNVEIHTYVHYILGEALLQPMDIIYYRNKNNCRNFVKPLELDKSRC
jgi:hypothetical protein